MWAFLIRGTEDKERSIVFLGEELEGSGVFEGVDGVFLGEFFGQRDAQLVKISDSILDNLRTGCTSEEEGGFGVLDWLGGFFVKSSLGARIAGFSAFQLVFVSHVTRWQSDFLHLSQHLDFVVVEFAEM